MFLVTMSMILTLEYLYSTSSTFPSFIVRKYVSNECETDPTSEPEGAPDFVKKMVDAEKALYAQSDHEVRHIGFLKVHKAASSTIQNIFFRFGHQRNLSFVFTTDANYFSRKKEEHYPILPPRYRTGYDILCNHGIFNYETYASILPADTVYIAIVRDPLELFLSSVNYYTQTEMYIPYLRSVPGNKVQNLIRNTSDYDPELFSYSRNVMARDLGFPATEISGLLDRHLKLLERKLKLVMLVEYFEESLVLLKRYLNWDLKDILYIPNNVFGKGYTVLNLTASDIELFNERNKLDVVIYNYFYARFWKQFSAEGEDIHGEVVHYKNVLKKLTTFCKNNYKPPKKGKIPPTKEESPILESVDESGVLIIKKSLWNKKFTVKLDDCKYMLTKELDFIGLLRKVQGSEILPSKVFVGEHAVQTDHQRDVSEKDKYVPEPFMGDKLDSKKYYRGWRLPVLRDRFRKEYKVGNTKGDQKSYV